jgi:hypothetical protein
MLTQNSVYLTVLRFALIKRAHSSIRCFLLVFYHHINVESLIEEIVFPEIINRIYASLDKNPIEPF